jgi:hypothetical protein
MKIQNKRPDNNPVIWIIGCSISHGTGVGGDERYGHLVSQELNMTSVYLTEPGTSIEWAVDQILRADIRPGDKLVWGLTGINRFVYYFPDGTKQNVTWHYYNKLNPKFENIISQGRLLDENLAFKARDYVYQVINFLEKIGSVDYCIIWVMRRILKEQTDLFSKLVNNIPNFVLGVDGDEFIDVGTDNQHPGPRQHQIYKNKILSVLK